MMIIIIFVFGLLIGFSLVLCINNMLREKSFSYSPYLQVLNGLIYVVLYLKFGLTIYFYKYAILSSLLIIISFIDLKLHIIPNKLNLSCLVIGFFFTLLYYNKWILFNNAIGLMMGGGLFLFIAIISKGAMGGGDIKLMGALGFCLGWKYIIIISLSSFIIGAIVSLILLILRIKSRKDYIPFGPFIAISAIIAMVYGEKLIYIYI